MSLFLPSNGDVSPLQQIPKLFIIILRLSGVCGTVMTVTDVLIWDGSVIRCISCNDPGGFSHVFTSQIHFTHFFQTENTHNHHNIIVFITNCLQNTIEVCVRVCVWLRACLCMCVCSPLQLLWTQISCVGSGSPASQKSCSHISLQQHVIGRSS